MLKLEIVEQLVNHYIKDVEVENIGTLSRNLEQTYNGILLSELLCEYQSIKETVK